MVGVLNIIITTIFVLLICGGTASAWLSGYDHRMAITVNNGGAATLYTAEDGTTSFGTHKTIYHSKTNNIS